MAVNCLLIITVPPKKKEEVKEKPILGRFKSNLKVNGAFILVGNGVKTRSVTPSINFHRVLKQNQVGIVGLPNVGKSTLFNTLTKMGIPAENFPFCTIDPNSVRCCGGRRKCCEYYCRFQAS